MHYQEHGLLRNKRSTYSHVYLKMKDSMITLLKIFGYINLIKCAKSMNVSLKAYNIWVVRC